jgi:biopolymer transport protein ExbB
MMNSHPSGRYVAAVRLLLYVAAAVAALVLLLSTSAWRQALAQDQAAEEAAGPSGERIVTAADMIPEAKPAAQPERPALNIFALAVAGGIFMFPIAGMSLLAVTMTIERFLALRKERVLPEELVSGLGAMAAVGGGFDPRQAYRLCQQFPSAAANVVRVMLLKVGRPLPEVESAVAHASQREADKLYANVRWINLAASLSTMLGLIGTIQGMIMAFHRLTVIDAAADRTTALADGIYTALVTTFAGLAVAIPALLFSHYFEGRIQELFRQIDELTFHLLPQVEQYEGRVRFGTGDNGHGEPDAAEPAEASAG